MVGEIYGFMGAGDLQVIEAQFEINISEVQPAFRIIWAFVSGGLSCCSSDDGVLEKYLIEVSFC